MGIARHPDFVYGSAGSGPVPLQVKLLFSDPTLIPKINKWEWDLDIDGVIDSTTDTPTFAFDTPGTHSVKLKVETLAGQVLVCEVTECIRVREATETIINPAVIVVDNEPCLAFISKSTFELVLEQSCILNTPIGVGSIVVGSHEGGYSRRVVSVSQNGSQLILQTENASLEEIFNQADISGLITFTPDDYEKAGLKIGPNGRAIKSVDTEIHAGVRIKGGIEIDPNLDWDCSVGWSGVKHLRAVFGGTLATSLEVEIGVEGGLEVEPKENDLFSIKKWAWYQIGYVPVIIYTEVSYKAGFAAGIEGDVSLKAGYNSATSVQFGTEYFKGASEPWRIVKGLSLNTRQIGPEFTFEGGGFAKVYFKPEVKLYLYGVSGPRASIEPYLKGELSLIPSKNLKLIAGIDGEIAFSLADLSCIGVDFDLGVEEKIEGPKVVLGTWFLDTQAGNLATPQFDANPTSGYAPLTVRFTDRSDPGDGVITSWKWNFGDGSRSTTQNPVHAFQTPGTYCVSLTVTGSKGSASWCAIRYITVQPPISPPVIQSFQLDGGAPTTTDREVYLSTTVTGNPTEYKASESPNLTAVPWKVFNNAQTFVLSPGFGTKTVYFKVKNSAGESNVVSDSINLVDAPQVLTIPLPNLPAGARPLRLVRIPAGSFLMGNSGSARDTQYGWSDEYPRHQVTIGYDFYLCETEVTQAQWQAVMGNNPSSGYGVGNDYPVYYVSWNDITGTNGFLQKLNALGYGTFRLPSEAEWEYACRGSAANPNRYAPFSFGDDPNLDLWSCNYSSILDQYMWRCGNTTPDGTKPVASKLPNDYGLYDMHGNVREWCQDYWHENYNGAPTNGSAWESPTNSYRVVRGGGWSSLAGYCRSALRFWGNPGCRDYGFGFRFSRTY